MFSVNPLKCINDTMDVLCPIGQGLGVVIVGLAVRIFVSYIVVLGNDFSWLEMCYVSLAWIPKAAVQVCSISVVFNILNNHSHWDKFYKII